MATKRLRILGSEEEYISSSMRYIRVINLGLICMAVIAVISLLLQNGFYLNHTFEQILIRFDFIIILYYVLQFLVKEFCARNKILYLKRHWFESLLALLILVELMMMVRFLGLGFMRSYFVNIDVTAITEIYIGFAQLLILLTLVAGGIRYNTYFTRLRFHPSHMLIVSFVFAILCGSGLLMLPRATYPGHPISYIDALFTAASATCVTGLTVVNTATDFTRFGQLIIICLVQIGGLGIMTISGFLVMFFGRGIGIRERVMLQEMLNVEKLGLIMTTIKNIVLLTFGIEAAAALLFMFFWRGEGWSLTHLIYTSIFHAISGFCNAGFSTFSDSMCSFSRNAGVLITLSGVIVLGGLGFMVIRDLSELLLSLIKRQKQPYHMKIQSRMVLVITGVLITAGALAFYLLDGIRKEEIDLINSIFMSIATRTAGFNSVEFAHFGVPTLLVFIFLMFIGGSPGSTGGGIKTTTFGVLIKSIVSVVTGQNRIILYRRRVPFIVLNRALVVFTFAVSAIGLVTFLLTLTENAPFIDLMFEATSAFATVGLSCGLSSGLTLPGKCIIIAAMFAGRIGTLTLAYAITAQTDTGTSRVEYPSESIMVG
jgi:trk system potassium uptake protein TrkH